MLYPSIDKILTKVDSKYMLVHVISQRSKQMLEYNHFQMKEEEYKNKKELMITMQFENCKKSCSAKRKSKKRHR